MTFYRCGGVRLMLGTAEPGKEGPIGGTMLYLKVAGIEAVCAELKEAGVAFCAGGSSGGQNAGS